MQDQILDMLLKRDEITWKDLITNLVKSEQMDPWDVDLSLLAQKYIEILKQLKEVNFFVSGKVVLAASILLKIKTNKLLNQNFADFDSLLFSNDDEDEEDYISNYHKGEEGLNVKLTIKTPQARKRKVSINDLVFALERALEVEQRRKMRYIREAEIPDSIKVPDKKIDIGNKITEIYEKIKNFLKKENKVTFSQLTPSKEKEDVIYTFIPLLHLDNQKKIHLQQERPFEEINIIIKEVKK